MKEYRVKMAFSRLKSTTNECDPFTPGTRLNLLISSTSVMLQELEGEDTARLKEKSNENVGKNNAQH